MAKVIEFYVSDFLPRKSNCIARKESRKLIEFLYRKEIRQTQILLNGQECVWRTLPTRRKLRERSNRRHHVSTTAKRAIPMGNGNLGEAHTSCQHSPPTSSNATVIIG
jgi:hypothetical protein